ncbi:Acetyl esterase/lipase [Paramicrobacterium humi]|uniref:Acetyl esterase/lipase n=1 Tax=Paramicrobacterium humi TaxID=640635 RepID=A0A1H4JZC4_9MICO|nr:alpha/beta hydrolase [Microbacterium humi]SEB51507.1 Acetyl esterase/lipase [Microbacterium humi]
MTSRAVREPEPRSRYAVRQLLLAAGAVLAAIGLVFSASPWPSVLLMRAAFDRGAAGIADEMRDHQPTLDIERTRDVPYATDSSDETLDLYRPTGAGQPLPAVVWIHGGSWISGSAANVQPYLEMIANDGYAAIGLNYTLGPEGTYPTAFEQLNTALGYISDHAAELGVDADRIVLAGDSAGAQLASQLAVLVTNPHYAHFTGITPGLAPDQLDAVILHCGVYDMDAMADLTGFDAAGLKIALWGYTGTKAWSQLAAGSLMSTMEWVTEDFPATFISGGNGDGLTWIQSLPMSQTLRDEGVDVTEEFFAADHEPALPHEYQFHLDLTDARATYDKTIQFLGAVTAQK